MFIKFVVNELSITNPYKVVLSNDRSKFKTTAYYNPQTGELAVYKKGRALIDIMRSTPKAAFLNSAWKMIPCAT